MYSLFIECVRVIIHPKISSQISFNLMFRLKPLEVLHCFNALEYPINWTCELSIWGLRVELEGKGFSENSLKLLYEFWRLLLKFIIILAWMYWCSWICAVSDSKVQTLILHLSWIVIWWILLCQWPFRAHVFSLQ